MSYRIRRGLFPSGNLYSKRVQEFSGNLVAHWPLNELSGAVAYDKSGNGNHGAITATTLGQAGIGDGLTSQGFDGSTSYIDISAIASNLVSNGGFETAGGGGADIWAGWSEFVTDGALANEAVVIHTGADACKITAGAGGSTYIQDTITVVPGETYRLRFWSQGDGTHDGRYRVYDVTNAGNIIDYTATGVTGAAYAMVDASFTAPGGCVEILVRFYSNATDTHFAYFDTVSLRRTDIPTFDPHEGSMIAWAKVASGAWTDGIARHMMTIQADAKNRHLCWKSTANNQIYYWSEGNDVSDSYTHTISDTGFVPYGLTWSLSGDSLVYYASGDAVGSDTGLGVFVGVLDDCFLGSSTNTPDLPYHGNLAHALISNTPWDADTMAYLMSLP